MSQTDRKRLYSPAGPWALEYADSSCRLMRDFEGGGKTVTLAFERFEMGPAMRLGLAGTALEVWGTASRATFVYHPAVSSRRSELLRTELADGRPSFLISAASLIARDRSDEILKTWAGAGSLAEFDREELAAAGGISSLVITEGFKDEPEFQLGPMLEPIKALQACAVDLVRSWGVDPERVAAMSRPPEPISKPQGWLNSSDYPPDMLKTRKAAVVQLRLIVNEEGLIEGCHFDVEHPGPFETAACQGIMARGRFTPALDADGKPMRTYWRQAVRFL